MILFVTKEKVAREIDGLLSQFELITSRADIYIQQDKIIGSLFGLNEIAERLTQDSAKILFRLNEAGAQARFGLRPLKAIAGDLPAVAKVASRYRRILDQMDRENAQGRAAADSYFGDV